MIEEPLSGPLSPDEEALLRARHAEESTDGEESPFPWITQAENDRGRLIATLDAEPAALAASRSAETAGPVPDVHRLAFPGPGLDPWQKGWNAALAAVSRSPRGVETAGYGDPCVFVPAHEPWSCSTHRGGMRTRLDVDRCRPAARARLGHWSWCALADTDHAGPCEAVAEGVVLHTQPRLSPDTTETR